MTSDVANDDWRDDVDEEGNVPKVRAGGVPYHLHQDGRTTSIPYKAEGTDRKRKKNAFAGRAAMSEYTENEYLADLFPALGEIGANFEDGSGSIYTSPTVCEMLRSVETHAFRRYHDFRHSFDESVEAVGRSDGYVHDLLAPFAHANHEDIDHLIEPFERLMDQRRRTLKAGFAPLAMAKDKTTAGLTQEFQAFLASSEVFKLIRYGHKDVPPTAVDWEHVSEQEQKIAPLVAWLSAPEMSAAVRAEALTHLSLYVESGWAEHDLGDAPSADPAILALRELSRAIVAGEDISIAELTTAIQARFDAVFISARVNSKAGLGRYTLEVPPEGPGRFRVVDGKVQGAGVIDALIRCHDDPHRLIMATVTAEADTHKQRDQSIRHANAVIRAAEQGQPPLEKGDRLDQIRFFSLALMPTETRTDLRTEMELAWKASGQTWEKERHVDFFNLLPLFSMLGADIDGSILDTGVIFRTRHRRFGAGNTPFDASRPEAEQAVEVARFLAQGIKELSTAMPYIRLSHASSDTRTIRKDFRLTFEMLTDAVHGLIEHYASANLHDPHTSAEQKQTTQAVLAQLKPVVDGLVTIAEHARIQGGSVKFADRALVLANKIDGHHRTMHTWNLGPGAEKVWALSRERAVALYDGEMRVRHQQSTMKAHLEQTMAHLQTSSKNANSPIKLVRIAGLVSEETFNHMMAIQIGKALTAHISPMDNQGNLHSLDDLVVPSLAPELLTNLHRPLQQSKVQGNPNSRRRRPQ